MQNTSKKHQNDPKQQKNREWDHVGYVGLKGVFKSGRRVWHYIFWEPPPISKTPFILHILHGLYLHLFDSLFPPFLSIFFRKSKKYRRKDAKSVQKRIKTEKRGLKREKVSM